MLPNLIYQVNSSLCAPYNRKGFLCSECKDNYGLYSSTTTLIQVGNGSAFILLLFNPPSLFFLVFLFLNIYVHSGGLIGFIFVSHIIVCSFSSDCGLVFH